MERVRHDGAYSPQTLTGIIQIYQFRTTNASVVSCNNLALRNHLADYLHVQMMQCPLSNALKRDKRQ